MSTVQCVVVTPERTELDVQAESVTVPLFDGEMGILKGHSPLVGRLGYGLLRIKSTGGSQNYFVEGGFVQVADNVVSILTDKVVDASQLNSTAAAQAMHDALALPTDLPELKTTRDKAIDRARALSRITA
ncbi:MAG: ATP synthase F1 subunit epsilon [Planctomycetales bacterium]|nr:ATP synthase F1 subunit epsilon [Planctomycetales bacterium]